jgi:putative hydrolase of the HAD superfamily
METTASRFKTIVFDFGRVIGHFDHRLAIEGLLPHSTLSADSLRAQLYGNPLEEAFEAGLISKEAFCRQIRDRCRFSCADDVWTTAYGDMFWPDEEICALIPALKKNYRLVLGSNTNELHANQFCKQFAETLGHFDALVLSHEARCRKPQAAFYERCVKEAGCRAAECIFIDDLPANIAGARACGLEGIVFTNAAELRKELSALGVSVHAG